MKDKAFVSTAAAIAVIVVALLTVLASRPAQAAPPLKFRNVTAGGELRPGVYGRIEPAAEPPPVIYPRPVIATQLLVPPDTKPVYLYVPPGQVRKWPQSCMKWHACDLPVLFVRVDHSPSRLGHWKRLREQYALDRPD